jgi:hypothetical protein
LSFKNHKKIFTPIFDKELKRYKYVYNASKFETWTEIDFKILVLIILLNERFSSIQSVLKYMQETSQKDLRTLLIQKEDLMAFQNTLKKDQKTIAPYEKKNRIIISLYRQKEITFVGLYWFMYNNQDQINGRIQTKIWKNVKLFFEFFPPIKENIEGIK